MPPPAAPVPSLMARADAFLGLPSFDRRRLWAPRFRGAAASRLHLCWRIFAFAYALSVSAFDASLFVGGRYLEYLTVQSVWTVVAYFALQLALHVAVRARPALGAGARFDELSLARGPAAAAWAAAQRAALVLFTIAVSFELVVVVLYWLLLASPQPSPLRAWDNAESHGVKLLLMYAELLVTPARPGADAMLSLPLAAGAVYLCVNAGVTLQSGRPVYGILNWRSAGSAVIVVGALAFLCVAFALAAAGASARDAAVARARAGKPSPLPSDASAAAAFPDAFDDDPAPLPCAWCCRGRAPAAAAAAVAERLLPAA